MRPYAYVVAQFKLSFIIMSQVVLNLDPPYTQNQYGTQYHLLETLILDDRPEKISKVTGSRSTREMRSDWFF